MNHSIIEEKTFDVAENNKRFSKALKDSLENKTYREVMAILMKEEHCPIKRIVTVRSTNNRIKTVRVYGCHSYIWIPFDKHTRRSVCVW